MAGYIGSKASVVSSGSERKKIYDITTTTTSLTGLNYSSGQVHVFHNGVRLVDGTDYTATNGTSITLTTAAENGDQVAVVSYASFQVSDTVSASVGGTFAGDISVTGSVTATSVSAGSLVAGTATYGGTADVITITTGLSLAALTTGMEIRFRATAANTGATTINVDAIGAVAALTITDAALPATYIRTDVDTVIRYNGTNWIADRQIERGSNANGQYVKWADGTLINTEDYGTSNAGTIGGWGTLTFAHAFVSAPTGFGCLVRAATSGSPKPYVYFHTNPSATQYFPLIADSGTFTTGYFTVTGLWY